MLDYGLTYIGSKNDIAEQIVNALPSANNFYDLFCGGGAILHCAKLSGKYKNFYANDINTLFIKGLESVFNDSKKLTDKRWISRNEFHKLKHTDFYVAYCFSFSADLVDYCYGEYIEPWKKALYYAKILNDYSLLKEMNINDINSKKDISKILKNIKDYYKIYKNWFLVDYIKNVKNTQRGKDKLNELENDRNLNIDKFYRLENVNRVQRLNICKESLAQKNLLTLDINDKVTFYNKSYDEIEILPNSVIYCDIPYSQTRSYYVENNFINFDYEKFYSWCEKQTNPIFISEYSMPSDRFTSILEIKKRLLCNMSYMANNYTSEKLFIPKNNK